ncbi:tripartite motif-containing protein 59 [Thalassophryne amazonica]|uniref:tripartite motif-containing protein 59 n=1 Tax=Thalassophryne amazonica TaxID=390379 RepID=UPI0014711072|nr:tripartite motif-containing protein 59 [Thalassophryne amazonica]XP_034024186.1 tripartite motif-containing protein 59 [Thalassophryne amazonica]
MDNLEEDLTCSVCYSLFSDPRVLPCSHTFCKKCLENLLQVSTNYLTWRQLGPLKCPQCRSVVEGSIDALPTNVTLRAIIEKYQKDSEPRPPSCEEHHRQPLNMYCIQDCQLICGLCLTVGKHQGHPVDDPQTAFSREKQTPSQLLAKLSEHRWAEVCELAEQLEQEKAHCEGWLKEGRLQVIQFFRNLEQVLARKRGAFLEALDEAGAEVSRTYDPLIHMVKELQEEQLDLVSLGSLLEEEDSPLIFLEKVDLFRERVEAIIKAPLPSVIRLSITPQMAQYLQEHWPGLTIGELEEAPVPKVCCCARCGSLKASTDSEGRCGQTDSWGQRLWWGRRPLSIVVLLALLLLLTVLWLKPGGGASLGFSLLSCLSQLVHMSSKLIMSFKDTAWSSYSMMEAAAARWSSNLFSAVEEALQQLTDVLKT